MQQEAAQRATDGLQPERSDTEEFQAEGRQAGREGARREGGRREGGPEGGGRGPLVVCCQSELLHEKRRAHADSDPSNAVNHQLSDQFVSYELENGAMNSSQQPRDFKP